MNEETATIEESSEEQHLLFPGERLYEVSRRVLFLCFFAIFILSAHQHLFAGHHRSKVKLIILMCLAPIILLCGLGSLIGWWQMRRAGAFKSAEPPPEEPKTGRKAKPTKEKREKHNERRGGPDLLPWQRRDRR